MSTREQLKTTCAFLIHNRVDVWTHPEEAVQTDGHPVGKKLLHYGLCAAQEKFGICIAGLVHQTLQKVLHDLCKIKQVSMESQSQQRCHCTSKRKRNRQRYKKRGTKTQAIKNRRETSLKVVLLAVTHLSANRNQPQLHSFINFV